MKKALIYYSVFGRSRFLWIFPEFSDSLTEGRFLNRFQNKIWF
jgi:hypothetical protein